MDPATIPPGLWGSVQVGMNVTSTGASVTFCCSGGTITGPLNVAPNGSFRLGGDYTTLQQSPVPATYSGTLTGNTMNLEVQAPPNSPWSAKLTFGFRPTAICFCPAILSSTR